MQISKKNKQQLYRFKFALACIAGFVNGFAFMNLAQGKIDAMMWAFVAACAFIEWATIRSEWRRLSELEEDLEISPWNEDDQ